MSGVCADQQQHKFQFLLSSNNGNKNIDIPPRKLLTRLKMATDYSSPRFSSADQALFRKFLPYNTEDDDCGSDDGSDPNADPYSSDHFRMFEFKIRRCTRSRSHDWTDCPFAHPGEKARRRDPRRHHYSGTVCADYRRGSCSRGDSCEFAHGVFECWLHPARYRTEACKDGKKCKRKVCFFAHTPRQLRVLPVESASSSPADHSLVFPAATKKKKYGHSSCNNSPRSNKHHHCCLFCNDTAVAKTTSSPTSTLLGMSHFSPPVSPAAAQIMCGSGGLGLGLGLGLGMDPMYPSSTGMMMSYKDVLAELVSSLEAMKFNEASSTNGTHINMTMSSSSSSPNCHPLGRWVDVDSSFNIDGPDLEHDQQQQFILSPSTPNPSPGPALSGRFGGRGFNFFDGDDENCSPSITGNSLLGCDHEHYKLNNDEINNGGSGSDPDVGWVNELLM